jgi:hypothetical protein
VGELGGRQSPMLGSRALIFFCLFWTLGKEKSLRSRSMQAGKGGKKKKEK